jgi:hypothetical protein
VETIAMRKSSTSTVAVVAGLLFGAAPVLAHHSAAVFDPNKRVTVTGVVTEWFWANPHCLLSLDVKGADGQVVRWAVGGRDAGAAEHDSVRVEPAVLQAR